MSKLTIVRGLPGSGKSTFASWLGCYHVENDMFCMHDGSYEFDPQRVSASVQWCMDAARSALQQGLDVVVANTFTKQRFISSYKAIAEVFNAKFEVYHMMGGFKDRHNVPDEVKKSMADSWEPWDGEVFIYPNTEQDPNDCCFRPYLFTTLKVGDIIDAYGGKLAKIYEIRQGTYDYLNIYYTELSTGKQGIALSGDVKKSKI